MRINLTRTIASAVFRSGHGPFTVFIYHRVRPEELPAGSTWVYDHPFFIILNVAVGGRWPGSPDETTVFPQTMLIDYVRVYGVLPR